MTDAECAVEGCDPRATGCGMLRIAPKATLEQVYDLGCGWVRWLVDVYPKEAATSDSVQEATHRHIGPDGD